MCQLLKLNFHLSITAEFVGQRTSKVGSVSRLCEENRQRQPQRFHKHGRVIVKR